jgi:hypothetical protein
MLLSAVERDQALRPVLALDGGSVRGKNHKPWVSAGYKQFVSVVEGILAQMMATARLRAGVNVSSLRGALVGSFERLVRDQMLAGKDQAAYSEPDWQNTLSRVIASCMAATEGSAPPQQPVTPEDDIWIDQYVELAEKALRVKPGTA